MESKLDGETDSWYVDGWIDRWIEERGHYLYMYF